MQLHLLPHHVYAISTKWYQPWKRFKHFISFSNQTESNQPTLCDYIVICDVEMILWGKFQSETFNYKCTMCIEWFSIVLLYYISVNWYILCGRYVRYVADIIKSNYYSDCSDESHTIALLLPSVFAFSINQMIEFKLISINGKLKIFG